MTTGRFFDVFRQLSMRPFPITGVELEVEVIIMSLVAIRLPIYCIFE
jgi:hypothetical protein